MLYYLQQGNLMAAVGFSYDSQIANLRGRARLEAMCGAFTAGLH